MSFKAGFIALLGHPNSGKSTLINTLVGEKVSIVSPKPQTTRKRSVGILNLEDTQAILVDAPGIIEATTGLNQFLSNEYKEVVEECDAVLAVLSLDEKNSEDIDRVIELARSSKKPWAAVITKEDLPKTHRISIIKEKLSEFDIPVLVTSCAQEPATAKELLAPVLRQLLPESPGPLYDSELYTLSSLRDLASEIIREKCFLNLHQELPFQTAVRIRSFDEESQKIVRIFADLMVSKENHKAMVIGRGAEVIKKIGSEARGELENLIGRKVFLDLKVQVRKSWMTNNTMMKDLGYFSEKKKIGERTPESGFSEVSL